MSKFDLLRKQIFQGLDSLNGEEFYFYGVDNNCFKIDYMVMEALEDPEDGYRSCLGGVCHKQSDDKKYKFFNKPLGKVTLQAVCCPKEIFDG